LTAKAKRGGAGIDAVLAAINRGFKSQVAGSLSAGSRSAVDQVIPTGIEVLDRYVLGCGGLPGGRLIELFSEPGCGKSTFAFHCLAACQRQGGVAVLAETEVALDPKRVVAMGVDPDRLVLLEPGHQGELFAEMEQTIRALPKSKGPHLLVWDSIASCPSKEEVEEGLSEKQGFDRRAKAISVACRILLPLAAEHGVTLLWINQVRNNIGVMYGDKFTTPGGQAVKFGASIRLQLWSGKAEKGPGGQHTGKSVTFIAVKNRLAVPSRKARVRLHYDARGWDDQHATLAHAKELKLVPQRSQDYQAARLALDDADWHKGQGSLEQDADDLVDDGT